MVRKRHMQWKGRDAIEICNGRMQVVVLPGGGHLAEMRILEGDIPSVNLLWEAPWETADPGTRAARQLSELYGGMPAGPFLAGFTGHALCLDLFGPPSKEETARGIPLHGEASTRKWELSEAADGCIAQAEMTQSKLRIARSVKFKGDESALFVEEKVENHSDAEREVHWVQHLTLGAPLLSAGNCTVDASVDRCRVSPMGYEGREALLTDAEFAWPWAPSVNGEWLDLRVPFQEKGRGILAAAHVSQRLPFAYIAALNWDLGLVLIYCFRKEDFPWVALWEENCAREDPPWNGTAKVRGMEFGTTPLPLGRDAIEAMGSLFDTPVTCVLPSGSTRTARYVACASSVPKGWRTIESVEVSANELTLEGKGTRIAIAAEGIGEFLSQERK